MIAVSRFFVNFTFKDGKHFRMGSDSPPCDVSACRPYHPHGMGIGQFIIPIWLSATNINKVLACVCIDKDWMNI